jgi:hypothetical protein
MMNTKPLICAAVAALATLAEPAVHAADWSDTAVSWRYGTRFREPYNPADIKKHIVALTHASGYQYGSNFFNVDLLQSDSNDPASLNQTEGAQEAYVVYRHTLDIGALRSARSRDWASCWASTGTRRTTSATTRASGCSSPARR